MVGNIPMLHKIFSHIHDPFKNSIDIIFLYMVSGCAVTPSLYGSDSSGYTVTPSVYGSDSSGCVVTPGDSSGCTVTPSLYGSDSSGCTVTPSLYGGDSSGYTVTPGDSGGCTVTPSMVTPGDSGGCTVTLFWWLQVTPSCSSRTPAGGSWNLGGRPGWPAEEIVPSCTIILCIHDKPHAGWLSWMTSWSNCAL